MEILYRRDAGERKDRRRRRVSFVYQALFFSLSYSFFLFPRHRSRVLRHVKFSVLACRRYSSSRRQNLHFCARESWFMHPILHVPSSWNVLLRSSGYNMKTQSSLLPTAIARVTAFLFFSPPLPHPFARRIFFTPVTCAGSFPLFSVFPLSSALRWPSPLSFPDDGPRIDFYPSSAKSSGGFARIKKLFFADTGSRLQQNSKTFH